MRFASEGNAIRLFYPANNRGLFATPLYRGIGRWKEATERLIKPLAATVLVRLQEGVDSETMDWPKADRSTGRQTDYARPASQACSTGLRGMLVSVEFVCKYDAKLHRHQSDPNSLRNRVNSASPGKRSGISGRSWEEPGRGESICYSGTKLGRVRFEHRSRQRGQRYQTQQCDLRISKRGRDRCAYEMKLNSACCGGSLVKTLFDNQDFFLGICYSNTLLELSISISIWL